MTGTIVVRAEQPGIGRAGTFGVLVDGVRAGQVRQGETARFPVPAGTHTVRVAAKDRTGSNAVTVRVAEDGDAPVTARGTGLGVALLLPLLAGITVPPVYAVATMVLLAVVFRTVPGLMFRVRVDDPEPPAPQAPQAGAGEGSGGAGLWWESDPALAKRFRKAADS
ncbi:hypothetical protein [Kitasatospora cineracea]|uniref:PEGA domain-containing protein n=1 Tax=Kitasatospora cineracea TaxID=88074 RepID=A0A3N4SHJ0_9ACTN|nr:hypothetical protein [Kitasatospora cineracea]ROR45602.1 hypothetical protein EDD39_3843 [Kitasatospora cineracea]RPE35954.1 hypothetical protein EDD38_4321 [Kitasatospora cineracea]